MKTPIQSCVIVKCNYYCFDYKAYNKEKLGHLISKEDFEGILEETNTYITKAFKKKALSVKDTISFKTKLFLILCLIFSILVILFSYLSTLNERTNKLFYGLSILFFCLIILILFFLILNTKLSSLEKYQTLDDLVRDSINKYLFNVNRYFQGYLEWLYISDLKQIEINIFMHEDFNNLNNLDKLDNFGEDINDSNKISYRSNNGTESNALIQNTIIEESDNALSYDSFESKKEQVIRLNNKENFNDKDYIKDNNFKVNSIKKRNFSIFNKKNLKQNSKSISFSPNLV